MTEPGLRASSAEREQVIEALKAAFVQGRLTGDELGERTDRVYTSRTHAELAEVITDIPTALTGPRTSRAPWRATKRAWWFEYAAFLPGVVSVIFLPGGPDTTIWTLITMAAVAYPAFWAIGVLKVVFSRRMASSGARQLPPLSLVDRERATRAFRTALAQGRLTEDEFQTRAVQASAASSRAELDTLTADLPPGLTARLPRLSDAWTGAGVSLAATGVLATLLVLQPDDFVAFATAMLAAATVLLAPPVTVGLIVDARHQKRAGRQLRLG